ncbi:MAG: hypothetical protein M0R46_08550 [Candidatus Muirbacterium halophilum]|nr:hypothetical protein [Candidatus Muirbacterium halophilum]MCK9475954.1 hypothetical protein [Candidatus Muirbacterium halophilum]
MIKCKKCMLIASKYIKIQEDGICDICHEHKPELLLSIDFEKKVKKIKKQSKGKYHCILMCSGGKDSVSALLTIKEKYGLNPIVFTFDHGFEDSTAINNVIKACKYVDCDSILRRYTELKSVFKVIVKENIKVSPCSVCSMWYMIKSYELAKSLKVKYIIAGWTKGQMSSKENKTEYMEMSKDTSDFIKNRMRQIKGFEKFPLSMDKINQKYGKGIEVISPHWFNSDISDNEKIELIKKTGWEKTDSYPKNSTNCIFNFISSYIQLKCYGYTHYNIEMSKLIRQNQMTKEQAQEKLEFSKNKDFLGEILIKNRICDEKDWDIYCRKGNF